MLRKWSSSEPLVLQAIFPDSCESKEVHSISTSEQDYTKTLSLEWNIATNMFHITISELPSSEVVTKRIHISDIAKVFDVFGWFAPANCQYENSSTESLGETSRLGWSSTRSDPKNLAPVEIRTPLSRMQGHAPLLFSKECLDCVFSNSRFLWCIRGYVCRCCIPPDGWLNRCSSYFTRLVMAKTVKLTYEELSTVLAQIDACWNSRLFVSVDVPDEDGIQILTSGHFLIWHPLCALPDPSSSHCSVSLQKTPDRT